MGNFTLQWRVRKEWVLFSREIVGIIVLSLEPLVTSLRMNNNALRSVAFLILPVWPFMTMMMIIEESFSHGDDVDNNGWPPPPTNTHTQTHVLVCCSKKSLRRWKKKQKQNNYRDNYFLNWTCIFIFIFKFLKRRAKKYIGPMKKLFQKYFLDFVIWSDF